MKNYHIILLVGISFFFSSCANVEKMVDRGNYDQALIIARKKMIGKKKIKSRYVIAAEEAFEKVTQRDMNRIEQLENNNRIQDWEKVLSISKKIENRQNALQSLLPLVAENGYRAKFAFVKSENIRTRAVDQLITAYFAGGVQALDRGRIGNKLAARSAYKQFQRLMDLDPNYKNVQHLVAEAEQIGITDIGIRFVNESNQVLPQHLQDELLAFYDNGRVSQWKRFQSTGAPGEGLDFVSRIVIRNLDVSPESVEKTTHHFHKEIVEKEYARNEFGQVMTDTAGNKVQVFIKRDIRAIVEEIVQRKEARVEMRIDIFDGSRLIDSEQIQAFGTFGNDACRISGDRRAVEGKWLNLGQPTPFPSDEELILTAADELKIRVSNYLLKYEFNQS